MFNNSSLTASQPKSFTVKTLIRPSMVCVCVCVCEEEVLRNVRNVYCSVWEGVMGGRLLCFMVLGTADLSLAPVSGDPAIQQSKQRDVCVCVCPSICLGKIPNNHMTSTYMCVCVFVCVFVYVAYSLGPI